MKDILNIYKPIGVTPYQLIVRLKEAVPEYKDVKMGYAGRLDPLAYGVLLLMLGEANKEREKYIGLEKTYEFRVLFGVETDTFDYLGLLQPSAVIESPPDEIATPACRQVGRFAPRNDERLETAIRAFVSGKFGKQTQSYPPFSSKTIGGVSLFALAKKGKLDGKEIPSREVTIHEFTFLGLEKMEAKELQKIIIPNLKEIRGRFRQGKIIKQWVEFFRIPFGTRQGKDKVFTVAKFSITCTSGTYVRALANEMGQALGCGAIALEILRTKVGEYILEDSFRLKY